MSRDALFAEHPMFKRAATFSAKPSSKDRLKNLVEFRENIVFVWSPEDRALLAANINSPDDSYQTLRLIAAPAFEVERVSVSAGCARAAVWGARGVVVAELPTRLHRSASAGGSTAVLCKSSSLDERFLLSQAEVRRVHWHPDSLAHLLVLVSDNTIRLYNVALKSLSKLVRVLNIGPTPSARLAGRPILESLGDTAVDFDLAPDSERLLLLRGNGDVYTVNVAIGDDNPIPPKLCGPLAMYPPADDNYGEDSCSIMVLGRGLSPCLVVIATCSAVLYHCLLLPDANTEYSTKADQDKSASDLALYVVECVEFNIVLSTEDLRLQYSYPVHLYSIPNKNDRYACVHAAGVHTVTLPIMSQMKEYVEADNNEAEGVLCHLLSRPSVARYLLCTHAPGGEFRPPRGACFLPPSALPRMLLLLDDGEVVTRSLEPHNLEEELYSGLHERNPDLSFEHINSLLKEREKMSFLARIQDVLTRSVSQPLLKLTVKEEPSPKETIEFLAQATMKLNEEYMKKQEKAASVIANKLQDLHTLRRQQLDWFREVQVQAEDVTAAAVGLRERCSVALKRQNELRERCWNVLRVLRADAATTPAERELLTELHGLRRDADRAAEQIAVVQDTLRLRRHELQSWEDEYKRKEVCLGRSHSDTISSIIQQQSSQLSSLIEDTKLLKDQLSIA